jgi:hypothetical protein
MSELNNKWAQLTNQNVKDWESDSFKLDLNFLSNADRAAVASEIAGSVSEDFYAKPQNEQDPYIFYFMLLTVENSMIMQAVLKIKGV